jgi:putative ABC transport system permease protein
MTRRVESVRKTHTNELPKEGVMSFLKDLKYGVRLWLARPGFAFVAIAALGIAIGANVTVYSVARGLVLSPVRGMTAPEGLVELGRESGGGFDTMSYPTLRDIAAQSQALESVFGFSILPLNVRTSGDTQRALGFLVTPNYFEALGVAAAQGRLLAASDDSAAAPVVVASRAAFERWFAGDSSAIGKVVTINGKPYTLLGVTDAGFRGHIAVVQPDFYLPIALQPVVQPANGAGLLEAREANWLLTGGRLAPGATLDSARTELATISARLRAAHPSVHSERFRLGAAPLRALPGELATGATAFSAVMGLLVLLVLLVACVNVAGMLIARGEARSAEIAMRYALGASRGRVVAQNLAENAVLAVAAGGLGIVLAFAATRALPLISLPAPFPITFDVPIDAGVLAFAVLLAMATALLFGLLPALRVSRAAPRSVASTRALGLTREGTRLRSTLVVGQVALSVLLLVAAGIFMRALVQSSSIDPGFDVDGIVAADLDLEPTGYEPARAAALAGTILGRVRAMPGVDSAALVRVMPLTLSSMSLGGVDVAPGVDDDLYPDANVVSPGYFETLSIALRGRDFAASDAAGAGDVAVVNARLAQRLFGAADPIGRTFRYGQEDELRTLTVIGVAADGKYNSLWEDPKLALWLPVAQWPTGQMNVLLATDRHPADVGAQLRTLLGGIDRELPPPQAHAMRDVIALSLLPQRIASAVAGTLGAIAALLAAIGLYGLVAYQVAARKREIGVRLALGASPRRIGQEVAGSAARLVGIGIAVGLALSVGLAQVVATQLFGASAADVFAFAGGVLVLVATAAAACAAPVLRATRVAPIDALRDD